MGCFVTIVILCLIFHYFSTEVFVIAGVLFAIWLFTKKKSSDQPGKEAKTIDQVWEDITGESPAPPEGNKENTKDSAVPNSSDNKTKGVDELWAELDTDANKETKVDNSQVSPENNADNL